MTPTQYAQTVPHHTVYGCLYIRDEHDRPIQLRSVYGSRLWQFPGGNLDAPGEDPLQTARREAVEETGLELGLDTPKLLLTHFLHAGPRLPLNKVGLIFDGGQLTADQFGRIRLDPAEHDMWAVHDLATWQELMAPRAFARLDALERARRGEGPAYLISPAPPHRRQPCPPRTPTPGPGRSTASANWPAPTPRPSPTGSAGRPGKGSDRVQKSSVTSPAAGSWTSGPEPATTPSTSSRPTEPASPASSCPRPSMNAPSPPTPTSTVWSSSKQT
ncbi:NUDIX domain-containing protein [Streptomyces canus]|uniref:NUDIX domain-containing protein n=1 Tax=Streptomyces canus TaxID=58343 RepID=UPI003CED308E